LHVLTDALGSVGAIVGGLLIWAFDWNLADPIVSILIGLLVVYSSWNLLRESTNILMQTTPPHIDLEEIRNALAQVPGVTQPHDLHVWTMTDRRYVLTCHITVADAHTPADALRAAQAMIRERFLIEHITIQTEPLDFDQPSAPESAGPA
ncbi:MAG: cation diffusion facilitator family transporter, partial [Planctomycetaceae bacterium]